MITYSCRLDVPSPVSISRRTASDLDGRSPCSPLQASTCFIVSPSNRSSKRSVLVAMMRISTSQPYNYPYYTAICTENPRGLLRPLTHQLPETVYQVPSPVLPCLSSSLLLTAN